MKLIVRKFAQSPTDLIIRSLDPGAKYSTKLTNLINWINSKNPIAIYTLNVSSNKGKLISEPSGLLAKLLNKYKLNMIGIRGLIVEYQDNIVLYDTSSIVKDKSDRTNQDNVIYNYSIHDLNNGSNPKGLIYSNGNWIEKPLKSSNTYKVPKDWITCFSDVDDKFLILKIKGNKIDKPGKIKAQLTDEEIQLIDTIISNESIRNLDNDKSLTIELMYDESNHYIDKTLNLGNYSFKFDKYSVSLHSGSRGKLIAKVNYTKGSVDKDILKLIDKLILN